MELIKVTTNTEGKQVVSARELHSFLEAETRFNDWMPRMLQYGFTEGIDFYSFLSESTGGRPSTDYALTLDCAKEISMIQRTEKGKQARQYFLECEKKLKETAHNPVANISKIDLAKMLIESEEQRIATEQKLVAAATKIKSDAPKVLFADSVCESKNSILIKELAGYLTQNGVKNMGQNRLFEWLRVNEYLCTKGEYHNLPTQKALDRQLFEVKKRVINMPDGTVFASNTTKVTGKGQVYFLNKFLGKA